MLGGSAFSRDIKKYANQKGFRIISIGKNKDAQYMKIADEAFNVDFMNFATVAEIVKNKNIDGIFCGAAEVSILAAISISEITGVKFYTNKTQWEQLSSKESFKNNLRKYDIGAIPEYDINDFLNRKTYTECLYPVIIKPVDGSGAKGISICNNYNQLNEGYRNAIDASFKKKVILEKYLIDMDDVFIRYHIQDNDFSISSSFDKYTTKGQTNDLRYPLAYLHPTKHLKSYIENIDSKMRRMIKSLGIKNGVMTLQAFVDNNNNYYFYEAGFRLGGSQSYLFSDAINNSNSLHYMINLALAGKMSNEDISLKDNPFFNKHCCNLYFPATEGKIEQIKGLKEISSVKEVINITEYCKAGDYIHNTKSLDQVCFRMHLMADSSTNLSRTINRVNSLLQIIDINGKNLIMEYFTDYDNYSKHY